MADVEVTYNNNKIVELSASGTKTLKTAGKYCEDDIVLEYERPAGGGGGPKGPVCFLFPFQNTTDCAAGNGTCYYNNVTKYWPFGKTETSDGYATSWSWDTGFWLAPKESSEPYSYYIDCRTTDTIDSEWTLDLCFDWPRKNLDTYMEVKFAGIDFKRSKLAFTSCSINGTAVTFDSHSYSYSSHMAFVYTGTELRIFENGELLYTQTVSLEEHPKQALIYCWKKGSNSPTAISNLRLVSKALGTADSFPVPENLYTGNEYLGEIIRTDLDPSTSINFYDYDGTLVTQWPLTELQAKTTLPDCPVHDGLTSQGWNWSLADLKTANHACQVGALYIPTDGKTHIFIDLTKGDPSKCVVPLYFNQSVANGVTIDWGDESTTETVSGTGNVSATHVYAENGEYEITVEVASGCTMQLGWGGSSRAFLAVADSYNSNPCICTKCYLGSGITAIRVDSFRTNVWLEYITIPRGVTSIGNTAFWTCVSLKALVLPDGFLTFGTSSFECCYDLKMVSLPNSVTGIGNKAFYYCHSLENIATYGTLGAYSFQACSNLKNLVISTTGAIATGAFYTCDSLQSVVIRNGATTVNTSAFYYCGNLREIHIPESVTGLGNNSFNSCRLLYKVSGCENVTIVGSNAFAGCFALQDVPELTLSTIAEGAFTSCHALTTIVLKGTLASQGQKLFIDCGQLSHVTLSDTQTAISAYCFKGVRNIESITIPASITSIGTEAFAYCNGLKEVHFKRQTPPSLGNSRTFSNIQPHCVFYVPSGCLSAYTSTTNYPSSSTYTYVEESA